MTLSSLLLLASTHDYINYTPKQSILTLRQIDSLAYISNSVHKYTILEMEFILNLMVKEDKRAKLILDTLERNFPTSQRFRLLKSMYYEAMEYDIERVKRDNKTGVSERGIGNGITGDDRKGAAGVENDAGIVSDVSAVSDVSGVSDASGVSGVSTVSKASGKSSGKVPGESTVSTISKASGKLSKKLEKGSKLSEQSLSNTNAPPPKLSLTTLGSNPNEMRLSRRLCSRSRNKNYISNLNFYLNLQPNDLVTWAEVADEYKKIGQYKDYIFCLQEILLHDPIAYPIWYKIGVGYYKLFLQNLKIKNYSKNLKSDELSLNELLISSSNHFLRAIEIADYKNAYYGLLIINKDLKDDKIDKLLKLNEKKIPKTIDDIL